MTSFTYCRSSLYRLTWPVAEPLVDQDTNHSFLFIFSSQSYGIGKDRAGKDRAAQVRAVGHADSPPGSWISIFMFTSPFHFAERPTLRAAFWMATPMRCDSAELQLIEIPSALVAP